MDSALSAKMAEKEGYEIIAVHFNYGQRTEAKELECFRHVRASVGAIEGYEIDLPFFEQIGASALTDKNIEVPTNGLEEGVPVTYVPFRNGIFLSIAAALGNNMQLRHFISVWLKKTVQAILIVENRTSHRCKKRLTLVRKKRRS